MGVAGPSSQIWGGRGRVGVAPSEITVYGLWVKLWFNLLSSTQAKRKAKRAKRAKPTGNARVSESLPSTKVTDHGRADGQK